MEREELSCNVCGDSAKVELRVPFLQRFHSNQQYIARWVEMPIFLCRDDEILYKNLRQIPKSYQYLKRTQRLYK